MDVDLRDGGLAQDVREAFRAWVVERRVARSVALLDEGAGPRRERALIGSAVVLTLVVTGGALRWWWSLTGGVAALWAPVLGLVGALILGMGATQRGRHPLPWLLGYLGVGAAIPEVGRMTRELLGGEGVWPASLDHRLVALWFGVPVVLAAVLGGLRWLDGVLVDAGLAAWRQRRAEQLRRRLHDELGDGELAIQRDPEELFDDLAAFMDERLGATITRHRDAVLRMEADTHAAIADLDAKVAVAVALAVDPAAEAEALQRAAAPARERLEARLDRADVLLREASALEASLRERFRGLADLKALHDRELAAAEASRRAREAIAASGAVAVALDDRLQRSTARLADELGGLVGLLEAGQRALRSEREVARLSG